MSRQGRFELFKGNAGRRQDADGHPPGARREWYWRLRSINGEIVAQSEGYTDRGDAERGVGDVIGVFLSAFVKSGPTEIEIPLLVLGDHDEQHEATLTVKTP